MRSTIRRLLAAVAILTCAAAVALVAAPAAHAGTCYEVQVGPQWVTVCP